MENVYNIERMPVLPKALQIFKDVGYGVTTKVLDASLCGVPQARKRFFAIGHLGDKDGFLLEGLEANLADHQMTVRDYLGNKLHTQFYYMHPRSYNRRAVFSIDEPSATIRGVNRPIPETYTMHHGDAADVASGSGFGGMGGGMPGSGSEGGPGGSSNGSSGSEGNDGSSAAPGNGTNTAPGSGSSGSEGSDGTTMPGMGGSGDLGGKR